VKRNFTSRYHHCVIEAFTGYRGERTGSCNYLDGNSSYRVSVSQRAGSLIEYKYESTGVIFTYRTRRYYVVVGRVTSVCRNGDRLTRPQLAVRINGALNDSVVSRVSRIGLDVRDDDPVDPVVVIAGQLLSNAQALCDIRRECERSGERASFGNDNEDDRLAVILSPSETAMLII